jgi:membrane protease YdiL (CAAX protease family)
MARKQGQDVLAAIRHLTAGLRDSRLLTAYAALGILSGFGNGGPIGFAMAVANYALLGAYVLVIYLWTRRAQPVAGEVNGAAGTARSRNAVVVVAVFALDFAFAAWFWSGGLSFHIYTNLRHALAATGWDPLLAGTAANALVVTGQTILLAALVLVFFKLRPRQLGVVPRWIVLGLVLSVAGIAFAPLSQALTGQTSLLWSGKLSILLVMGVVVIQPFINGLPEEFVFRGIILSRLVALLRRPGPALVLSSVLFTAFHIPSKVAHPHGLGGLPLWIVIPGLLLTPTAEPTGLAWGYLFYRTRSIWPGAIWHTSTSILGCTYLGC